MDMPSNVRGALASIYSYNSNGTFILIDTVEDQEVLALIKEDEGMDALNTVIVNTWLLQNGAGYNEEILIKYWW